MKNYYYYSEMGCVKIGNENFNLMLLNDKGEGSFWIHLCEKKENFDKTNYEFVSVINGKDIAIYECEKSNNKIVELSGGEYHIYKNKGNILLETIHIKN